jgi:hypothetical protein
MDAQISAEIIDRYASSVAAGWKSLAAFAAPPPGVSAEVVVTLADFRNHYKKFDHQLGNEITNAHSSLGKLIGIEGRRSVYKDHVRKAHELVQSTCPKDIYPSKDVSPCLYQVNEFLFRYVAVGEKSVMGEYMLQCYPRSGLPCGFDERESILFLYQPELI